MRKYIAIGVVLILIFVVIGAGWLYFHRSYLCFYEHIVCLNAIPIVYVNGFFLQDANPETFRTLDKYYGRDDSNVYWIIEGEEGPPPHKIIGADLETFAPLSPFDYFAKDKNTVFWAGLRINGADPATFNVEPNESWYDSYDNMHKYKFGKMVQ